MDFWKQFQREGFSWLRSALPVLILGMAIRGRKGSGQADDHASRMPNAQRGTPKSLGSWKFNSKVDLDWRGRKGSSFQILDDALDEALKRTGIPRSEFKVTKWGKTVDGKTVPVEWRVTKGPNAGAEVNIDDPRIVPSTDGPANPHVLYQSPGKRKSGGAVRGHIILDDVPVSRGRIEKGV